MASPTLTLADLKRNDGKDGRPLWIQIGHEVFDVAKFADFHPGGASILRKVGGRDATEEFRVFHQTPAILARFAPRLKVGELEKAKESREEEEQTREMKRTMLLGEAAFGDQIPYGDPMWYQRGAEFSPYYKETHRKFRERVRRFMELEVMPTMREWANSDRPPAGLLKRLGEEGFIAAMCGGPPFPADEYLSPSARSNAPEGFDYFHSLILFDEIARCGDAGVVAALTNGPAIAIPAILKFGSAELKRSVLPSLLAGEKIIALGVTEVYSGSDVAGGTQATVKRDPKDGKLKLSGVKKFITNGTYADFFNVLVRDEEKGGLSSVLLRRDAENFKVSKVKIQGSDISGTAYLDFDEVVVEESEFIGERGKGFMMQMSSFNFERLYLSIIMLRCSRVCIEECFKFSLKRKTLGKELANIQSIRMRLAEMIRSVESLQAWIESLTYQLCQIKDPAKTMMLGDVFALIKVQASYVVETCARHTTHIFGGLSLQSQEGNKIDKSLPQTKAFLIPAGAADVLDDFSVRQALKIAKQVSRL